MVEIQEMAKDMYEMHVEEAEAGGRTPMLLEDFTEVVELCVETLVETFWETFSNSVFDLANDRTRDENNG